MNSIENFNSVEDFKFQVTSFQVFYLSHKDDGASVYTVPKGLRQGGGAYVYTVPKGLCEGEGASVYRVPKGLREDASVYTIPKGAA